MAPTLFIVPGYYEGPEIFEPLIASLKKKGVEKTFTTKLPSTGTSSKDEPAYNLRDDVDAIAKDMKAVVEEAGEDGVILLCHSAGGFLGPDAMKGLSTTEREASGDKGGIFKIIFFVGVVLPPGHELKPEPWMINDEFEGTQVCIDYKNLFYNDFSPEDAELWINKLKHQPAHYERTIKHSGWLATPSVYIIATLDGAVPVGIQGELAKAAKSKVLRIEGGHMAHISKTEELSNLIAPEIVSRT